jgi:CheY-like chemotaxis protein
MRGRKVQNEPVIILVVEDDHAVQVIVEEALSEGGFEIAVVQSGEEAIALLEGTPEKYRALLTDINLAGNLDGWDVAKRARELKPDIPVVYMTGAAGHQWSSHGVPNSILLNKPFAPAQIVAAVAQLLNTATPPAQN